MKKASLFLFITTIYLISSIPTTAAAEFQHSIDFKKMQLFWTVEKDSLKVRLVGKTKGWLGVGFNPTRQMQNANIIIGYVKRGRLKISDDFGIRRTDHKSDKQLKGKNNLRNTSGSEKRGVTIVNFTIPLDSGDKYDRVIKPDGNTRVIVATGKKDSLKLGHNFQAILDLNLRTGKYRMQ